MSYGKRAPGNSAPIRRDRSAGNANQRNFLAGVVAAGGMFICGLMLIGRLFHVATAAASLGSVSDIGRASFADRFAAASFDDRSEPIVNTSLEASVEPAERQIDWLNPIYSFGPPAEKLAGNTPAGNTFVGRAQVESKPPPGVKPQQVAVLSPPPTMRQLVASIPIPMARPSEARAAPQRSAFSHEMLVQKARAALLASAKSSRFSWFDKLFGNTPQPSGPVLAYAGSDVGELGVVHDAAGGDSALIDRATAVYDISARTVYMPDGTKLEAHSGLGDRLDNPAYAHEKMIGVTPPHIYDLKPREALFHGVPALRLIPVGGDDAIFGRRGLLAHTYMLGPNGDSNGCVSFKDYDRFLQAYRNGDVKQLVVIAKLN